MSSSPHFACSLDLLLDWDELAVNIQVSRLQHDTRVMHWFESVTVCREVICVPVGKQKQTSDSASVKSKSLRYYGCNTRAQKYIRDKGAPGALQHLDTLEVVCSIVDHRMLVFKKKRLRDFLCECCCLG